jgi:hydroxyacylglutathione hydrolase
MRGERSAVKVFQIPVGPMQNFAYLVEDEESREAMAVDSGWETEPIVSLASREGMRVKYVCATHGHYDHVKTIDKLAAELGAATVAFEGSEVSPKVGVGDGDILKLGESEVRVIHTPGHTEDSVCYYDGSHLFTGDTLFIDAWGRTDLPGGSSATLFSSLHEVIMALPQGTVIYPGHDYGAVPSRTLGEESRKNPALRARTVKEFLGMTQD